MAVDPTIRAVFDYFQNLNLLMLREDLRRGEAARGTWTSGAFLCPVAHGLADGAIVGDMRYLNQSAPLPRACDYAARRLGAAPDHVYRFVCDWDRGRISPDWLREQLEELWKERLEDAVVMQEILAGLETAEEEWEEDAERRVEEIESGQPVHH
jgi:hypothetical protein